MEDSDNDGRAEEQDLDLPYGWHRWPFEQQAHWIGWSLKRDGCLQAIRDRIDSDRDGDRVTRDELARILTILEGNR